MQAGKNYASPREALLLNAKFVAARLAAVPALEFSSTAFVTSLLAEVRHCPGGCGRTDRLRLGTDHDMTGRHKESHRTHAGIQMLLPLTLYSRLRVRVFVFDTSWYLASVRYACCTACRLSMSFSALITVIA